MLFKGFKNLSLYYLVSALFLTDKCLCLWPLEARSPADIRVPAPRDKSRLTMSFSQYFTVVWEAHLGVLHLFLWDLVSLALQPSLKNQKVAMYLSGAFQIEQAFTGLPVFSSISPPPSGLARAAWCWFSPGVCLFPDDVPVHRVAWGCAFYELWFNQWHFKSFSFQKRANVVLLWSVYSSLP